MDTPRVYPTLPAAVPHGGGGTGIGNSNGFELTVHPGSLDVTITAPATYGDA